MPEALTAQAVFESILNTKTEYVENFSKDDLKENQYYLASAFASEALKPDSEFTKVKSYLITKIEMVYTTFREAQSFNQYDLNLKRLKGLQKLAPEFFKNDLIEWKQIGVTGAHSSEEGKNIFHGFILTYRLPASKENTQKEIEYLKSLVYDSIAKTITEPKMRIRNYKRMPVYKELTYDNMVLPQFKGSDAALNLYLEKNLKYPKDEIALHREGVVTLQFAVDRQGKITDLKLINGIDEKLNELTLKTFERMPLWIPGTRNGKPATVVITLPVKFDADGKTVLIDSIPKTPYRDYRPHARNKEVRVDSVDATDIYMRQMEERDSLVFKAINRSKWNNILFICDVTGSMSPYSSQLLIWLKLNIQSGRIKHFVFFNDGDRKTDDEKVTGKVGGIYPVTSNNFNDITNTMFQCMENGDGGDIPENNIEAAIEAVKLFPECDTLVMIADNFATPRDLDLLRKLNKPIKVILCGTYAGINPKYLNMIRRNRGSLHTIEDDIYNLSLMHEGEIIEIDGIEYRLENGSFARVRRM